MKGLTHIYTGEGKGKTTAAIGLGIRAYGRGLKVLMVQFLKGAETGEMYTLEKLKPGFILYRGTEIKKFTWNMSEEELKHAAKIQNDIFNYAMDAANCGGWDMLILDEILGAVKTGLIELDDVTRFLKERPDNFELILTGRDAPAELIELADYVSDIKAAKHPMEKGIPARKGIEN
jgi:ATP:corrinoid adenosyltransferase